MSATTTRETVERRPAGARRAEPEARERRPLGFGASLVILAIAQLVVVLDVDLPVVRPLVAIVTFMVLPTLVLYRRGGIIADSAPVRLAYAFGTSLLALLVVGLLVNTLVPLVGTDRPLTPAVLGVAWFALDALLLAWRTDIPLVTRAELASLRQRAWDARVEPAQAVAVAALALSVVGAVRLNNGAGGQVAVLAHLLVVAAFFLLLRSKGSMARDLWTLFLVSLALLFATSLRGWGITGHDVQAEYYVYSLTQGAQHWSMGLLENAYNACLSVTLLPTLLAEASGLSGVVWFKVGLQVVFAVVPVVAFLAFGRILPRRMALVAVALIVSFPTFHTDMPYLVRQEIAFVFLSLALLAASEPSARPWFRRVLIGLFGTGVVLSHYSTTYLLSLGLGGGLVLLGLSILIARRSRRERDQQPLVLLHPATILAIGVTAIIWTGPVTHTGGHPIDVARDAISSVFNGSSIGSSDRDFFLLGGKQATERERLDEFVQATLDARKEYPARLALIKDPRPIDTRPELVEPAEAPVTPAGRALEGLGIDLGSVTGAARLLAALFIQLLLAIGVFTLVRNRFRRRPAPEEGKPAAPLIPLELLCTVLGVGAALGLVVVVPSLSVEYGVLRAFLQSMLFLAPVAALGLWTLLTRLGRRTTVWATAVTVVLMALLTSAVPALIGGGPARVALANAGLYYDRYVVPDSDRLAAERIAQAPDLSGPLPKVLAPRHQAVRLVQAGVPASEVADRTYPTVLNVNSYLFVDALMTREKRDTIFYSGDRITYRYPLGQIGQLLNLVYSAGDSRIYR